MRRNFFITLLMSIGTIVFAQNTFHNIGLLTTMEHPTDSNQGPVLAIMDSYGYYPIELKENVYAKAVEPLTNVQKISGKEILLDSIYCFERIWDNDSQKYIYDFKQLYKEAKYIVIEGYFVLECMGPIEPGGAPLPGILFYFMTKDGDKMFCEKFGVTKPNKNFEEFGSDILLGGWTTQHHYRMGSDGTFHSTPNTLYTIRFVDLEFPENKGGYIPTHVLSSKPLKINAPDKMDSTLINVDKDNLYIQSDQSINHVALISVDGYIFTHNVKNLKEVAIPLPPSKGVYVVQVDFLKKSRRLVRKIIIE